MGRGPAGGVGAAGLRWGQQQRMPGGGAAKAKGKAKGTAKGKAKGKGRAKGKGAGRGQAKGPGASSRKRARPSGGAAGQAAGRAGQKQPKHGKLRLPIPLALRKQLVDDWEAVTKDRKLVRLPRAETVRGVLDAFVQSRGDGAHASWFGFAAGVRGWFNDALRPVLLFRPEHDQLERMQQAEKELPQELCDIYGPEHLARLFVKLPGLLAASPLDSDSQKFLEARLGELVRWLARRERDPAAVYFSESPS